MVPEADDNDDDDDMHIMYVATCCYAEVQTRYRGLLIHGLRHIRNWPCSVHRHCGDHIFQKEREA